MRAHDLLSSLAFLSLTASSHAAFLAIGLKKDSVGTVGVCGQSFYLFYRHDLAVFFESESEADDCCSSALSAEPSASQDCGAYLYQQAQTATEDDDDDDDSDLPAYASACRHHVRYTSACSCIGVTSTEFGTTTTTTTVPFAEPTEGTGQRQWKRAFGQVNADSPLNLDLVCKSKVAEAVAAAESTGEVVQTTWTGVKTVSVTVTGSATATVTTTKTSTLTTTKTNIASCTAAPVVTKLVAANVAGAASQTASVNVNCLTDKTAGAVVDAFSDMLTNSNKTEVNVKANWLLAKEFLGTSTSVNSLQGVDTSTVTYPNASSFVAFLASAPIIPMLTTLDVFHDCNRIAWYWAASGVGGGSKEERGLHLLYTIDGGMADLSDGIVGNDVLNSSVGGKKVDMMMFEFDSLGWADSEEGGLSGCSCEVLNPAGEWAQSSPM